ncbi:MBL fold metallo-hydrolase [bacterium]|nr:MBL fold metallo-hydrolase [bacterium]
MLKQPDVHMIPEDAVKAHQEIKARQMFPVHWGTFNLVFPVLPG